MIWYKILKKKKGNKRGRFIYQTTDKGAMEKEYKRLKKLKGGFIYEKRIIY